MQQEASKIRLMQFNIRTGWADWGLETAWQPALGCLPWRKCRRSACAACIAEYAPDVVATQEGLRWQMHHLTKDLHGRYECIGQPLGTHYFNNETSAILYDKSRWDLEASGDFMLSATPEVWGSSYDGASWPIITTWVVLVGRQSDVGPHPHVGHRMLVISTHLDPRNPLVRAASAKQLISESERLRTEHKCTQAFLLAISMLTVKRSPIPHAQLQVGQMHLCSFTEHMPRAL